MLKNKSEREDKRGHWPAGRRRHKDSKKWQQTRAAMSKFIDDHWAYGRISYGRLAADIGVGEKSIRRWISGQHIPAPEFQKAIAKWIAKNQTKGSAPIDRNEH